MKTASGFTDREINLIERSLPQNDLLQSRRKLFPKVLHEWSRTDLQEHLSHESRQNILERGKRMQAVEKQAREFLEAIDALDEEGRFLIERELWPAENWKDRSWYEKHVEKEQVTQEFKKALDLLRAISSTKPSAKLKQGPGQPRNEVAYLVLRDLAAIFRWTTGQKAKRVTVEGEEAGPFCDFAAAVWPVVFGKGDDGLPAAMKNWASAQKKYREASPCISNMDMRHPSWRLLEA